MGHMNWIVEEFLEDPCYALLIPYMVGQPLFRHYVRKTDVYNKNKAVCKKIMAAYNLIMSVFSAICSVSMFYTIATMPNKIFATGHFDEPTGMFKTLTWFFYMSKYVEFLDTYFLILCDRPVSWLQYIHHIGAVIVMGFLHYGENDGLWIFVAWNGFIHTIMYYYYACCIMKWEFKLMPKHYITSMQLGQFVTGLSVFFMYNMIPAYWADVRKRNGYILGFAYVGILILLFANFYIQTYLVKKNKKAVVAVDVPEKEKTEARKSGISVISAAVAMTSKKNE